MTPSSRTSSSRTSSSRAPSRWIAFGALWTALGIGLGAFGAHALNERLVASDALDNWRTAVDYHVWHGLACVLFGLHRRARPGKNLPGWAFALGSVLFSGSLYGLCLDGPGTILGPITPLGGLSMIVGWLALALEAVRD